MSRYKRGTSMTYAYAYVYVCVYIHEYDTSCAAHTLLTYLLTHQFAHLLTYSYSPATRSIFLPTRMTPNSAGDGRRLSVGAARSAIGPTAQLGGAVGYVGVAAQGKG